MTFQTLTIQEQGLHPIAAYRAFTRSYDNEIQLPCLIQVEAFTLALCLRGRIGLEIEGRQYEVSEGCIMLLTAGQSPIILEDPCPSPDFACTGIAISQETWDVLMPELVPFYCAIRQHPVPPPFHDTTSRIIANYISLLHHYSEVNCNKYLSDSVHHLLLSLFYAINTALFSNKETENNRGDLLNGFFRLVASHFREERRLQFYADNLHISPKYLSSMIRRLSGKSAAKWIDNFVLNEACLLLRTSPLSILQISERLNFPEQSIFGKYFKRHIGIPPIQYRYNVITTSLIRSEINGTYHAFK